MCIHTGPLTPLGTSSSNLSDWATSDSSALYAPDDDLEEPEEVDHRVQDTLEELNRATEVVNKAEANLDRARIALAKVCVQRVWPHEYA